MHYHAEIIMPPTQDVEGAIKKYLADFSENNEEAHHAFFDWYQIGGRYSGSKVEALLDREKRAAFVAALTEAKITVSGLVWGKEEISPADQIPKVDAMWREHFPDSPMKTCPLFKHSDAECLMDICAVKDLPANLTAYTCIICGDDEPQTLLHKTIWNGCVHQDTDWDGSVAAALQRHAESIKKYKDGYREKFVVGDDWLCVTVDYHS